MSRTHLRPLLRISAGLIRDRGGFQTWLYRITRNLALNARKKKRAEPWPEGMEIVDARTPEDEARMREIFQGLDRVLEELGFQDRVIFVLAELEGLPPGGNSPH